MNTDEALQALAVRYGIEPSYYSFSGEHLITSPDTQRAVLNGVGIGVDNDAMIHGVLAEMIALEEQRASPEEYIVNSNAVAILPFGGGTRWQVVDFDASLIAAEGIADQHITLPPLKSGVYSLMMSDAKWRETVTLLVAPARSPSINDIAGEPKLWGVNAALYGLNSSRNGGVGDYEDLARLGEMLAAKGAGFLGVNPLHAIGTMAEGVISPYSPSHRAMLNTNHIALDQLSELRLPQFTQEGQSRSDILGRDDEGPALLNYALHIETHKNVLEAEFLRLKDSASFDISALLSGSDAEMDSVIGDFALFEAISEQHGDDWRSWPASLRDKNQKSLQQFRITANERIEYHKWLQYVADGQLGGADARSRAAGMPLGLYLDLAVGSRRGGAESWCNQDVQALGLSTGAPPDYFNPTGQNWQLAAMAPDKLKAQQYTAFSQVLRATMRHAGVLRIDHVLGLNRSFWIPDNGAPGCYINQPCDALAAIVRIEAERSGTVIIGEDLGLVPDGFREKMRSNGFYGYSVLQFEKEHNGDLRNPAHYDSQILACFGTHDTTTLQGFEEGKDIEWSVKLGWIASDQETAARQIRHQEVEKLKHNLSGTSDVILQNVVHSSLAYSPAELVSIQLDDVLGHVDSQNLPGTIDEHPNWRRQYSVPLDELPNHQSLCDIATVMREGGRSTALEL